ncbi:MAG: hypothetical protein RLZZ210_351 [Pseudomonadota bacterium]|jgi:23S rRNA pseudouridine1911/1915/1917 synthase
MQQINTTIPEFINEFILEVKDLTQVGIRIDKFLANELPFSRTLLQKWLELGYISVSNNYDTSNQNITLTAKYKIKLDDIICVKAVALPQDLAFTPQNIPLNIVYEDEHILIINKPVGMVVQPAPANWQDTLLNALLYHYPQTANLPRAGIVHRLDKMTSGIMVVAKTLDAQMGLSNAIQEREIKRQYLAIVQGLPLLKGVVNAPIGRHPSHKTKMAIVEHGKHAITHYTRIANLPASTNQSHSLLKCDLETGRTHQIRVHMASIGHPLIGDAVYNKNYNNTNVINMFSGTQRQALHATCLSFQHPVIEDKYMHYVVKPSDELMQNALNDYQAVMQQDLYEIFDIEIEN